MPLHEYKTQVLLLHSEQSTLDNLSSGFSDRYTVHCATSGSEALNTLVDTPINVIVTAQDLPGMSGLEALREAKKRSPDTVGILLAGNADDGLEALVGDKEVFQVVRGDITGDAITKIVDDATRQMRLMALAESANDTAANVDEPTEHIVMETSENGATIISDGTGRMPALDPEKISAAAAVGAQSVDILVLTKDHEFLSTIKDSSRGMHTVHYATTLAQADETIRNNNVGVAVVDAAMVGNKVEQLTQHLRKGVNRLVSVVAGRRDDGEMLMDLINRGKVYRFLLKPVSPGRARLAIEASVKHHLEAPDSAFKAKDVQPAAKAPTKAAPKPQKTSKTAAGPAAPKKQSKTRKAAAPAVPADPPLGTPQPATDRLAADDRLDTAFGDDDSSFTETVTGLIVSVGKKLSSTDETPKTEKPATATPPATEDDSPFRNPRLLGAAAAAVVIVVGTLFWIFSGSDEPTITEQATVVEEAPAETTPAISEADLDFGAPVEDLSESLIEEARLARDAGQIFNPPGSNALELYAEAMDAGNTEAFAEFGAVIAEALAMAETALLEDRLADADAALQRIGTVDPDNVRLPFLKAQLSQMQLRGHLADARSAILDERFEDAASSLASARLLRVADGSEIELVAGELDAARQAQQADEVLALANARLEEGDLLSPANDNARYYYQLVLSNDPQNTAAQQGLTVVANKLVLLARAEIDTGNFRAAQALLDDAGAVDPENTEVTAAAGALANAQKAIAEQQRQEEARLEAERLAAEARAEARAEAERRVAAERAAAERRAAEEQAALVAAQQQAAPVADEAADDAAPAADDQSVAATPGDNATANVDQGPQTSFDAAGGNEPGTDSVEQVGSTEPAVAQAGNVEQQGNELARVGISTLNRTKYVAPKYPRSAERRNLSGWVDVVFTVSRDGKVKDIEVRDSKPGDTFINAATRAVERWEFEPIIENGAAVEKRTGVRMMFAVE